MAAWADASGQGNDATQATAALRPTYRTNMLNGKPVVRFDGADDYLRTAAFAAALVEPCTYLIAAKLTAPVNGRKYNYLNGIAAPCAAFEKANANDKWAISQGGTAAFYELADAAWHIFTCLWLAGANDALYRDGAVGGGAPSDTGAAGTTGLTIGQNVPANDWPFPSDIAEKSWSTTARWRGRNGSTWSAT